jgi:hypothetical protein
VIFVRKAAVILAGAILTAILSIPASFLGLIGTQGMHGTEPLLEVLAFVCAVLVVVNAVAAAVGMLPVALLLGARPYRAAILGACVGAIVGGVLFTGSMRAPELSRIYPLTCFVIPAACGALAIALRGVRIPI